MRVAILVKGFPPSTLAGTEVATEHMARNLASQGVEVHVITVKKEQEEESEEWDGFIIHRVKERKSITGKYAYYRSLKSLISKVDPEVIHAQGMYSEALFGVRIAQQQKRKSLVFPRGSDLLQASSLTRVILRWILNNADLVLTQTNFMKGKTEALVNHPLHLRILPNGIDIQRYYHQEKVVMRKRFDIPENSFVFLFVGRLVVKKCPEDVITAFSQIVNDQDEVFLYMVGEGEREEELRSLITEHDLEGKVVMTGRIENERIPNIMACADAFVLPSYAEGFPMTFIEAMAAGLPILTSDDGANPEIVAHEVNGLISSLHDTEKLRDSMIKIMKEHELRERIEKNNVEKAKEFSWESITTKLKEIYLSLVESSDTSS